MYESGVILPCAYDIHKYQKTMAEKMTFCKRCFYKNELIKVKQTWTLQVKYIICLTTDAISF